ncbi:hypothetical protein L3Q82_019412, partial [Scortum barcoo]
MYQMSLSVWVAVVAGSLRRPNPKNISVEQNSGNRDMECHLTGGKEPELSCQMPIVFIWEVERYQARDSLGLTSTHSLGSGTQLLERGLDPPLLWSCPGWIVLRLGTPFDSRDFSTLTWATTVIPGGSKLWTQRSLVPVVVAIPDPVVDTGIKGCHQAEEDSPIGPCWPVGLLAQIKSTSRSKINVIASQTVLEGKNSQVWEEFEVRSHGGGLSVDLEEILANRPAPQKGSSTLPNTGGEKFTVRPPQGKVYARVLERRIRPIVDPWIQEEQCGFRPGRGTVDQLYTLQAGCFEGLWEFAQPVHMCFVDLEKAFDRVPQRGILWGVLREYGVRGPFAKGCSVSVLATGAGAWFLALPAASSSKDLQHVLERFAAECEAAGMMKSTPPNPEAMVLRPEKGGVPSPGEWRGPASSGGVQVSRGHHCSRVRERWSVRLTGGLVQRPQVMRSTGVPDRRGEEGAESADTSGRNEFPLRRVAGRSLRDRAEGGLGIYFQDAPGMRLPREMFQACPTSELRRPPGEDPGHAGETMSLAELACRTTS